MGYVVYKRTYARPVEDGSHTEEWHETVDRVVQATEDQLHVGFTDEEATRLKDYMLDLKGTVAGRFLWQLGTKTVDKLGLPSLQNCAAVVVNSPIRPFTWAFDFLMLGSGVGFNIQREYVYKLPPVREDFAAPTRQDDASADFVVPDTREGWVKLLEMTLESAFYPNKPSTFSYSTQLIRGKGAPIKSFGGVASGPEDLCTGIGEIANVIHNRRGKQLRPIDCLDIMNIIGKIVVSGNVRRSAEIAIGDADDFQFLRSKNWALGTIPNWRGMSNNSVVCNDINLLPEEFWEGYGGTSEPFGLINLKLSRACGRAGDKRYPDKKVIGYNPCAEQSLENHETCCLAEVFLPNVSSKEELLDLVTLLYRVNKHSLALACRNSPETERVVNSNMRMGIGITGYLSATEEQRSWLPEIYEALRSYDAEYSKERGFNPSIKLTTVKPSGTLSLLPIGITPGAHPAYAQYMIRRMRISSSHPLVEICKAHNHNVEFVRNNDGTLDYGTSIVEFPYAFPEGTLLAKDMSAIDQLEVVRRLQSEWSDNSVSCTIYYKLEEIPLIKEYLKKHYNTSFKSLSFLLHSGHGFDQAPLEEITKEKYDEMVASCTRIESMSFDNTELPDDDCASGACPVR